MCRFSESQTKCYHKTAFSNLDVVGLLRFALDDVVFVALDVVVFVALHVVVFVALDELIEDHKILIKLAQVSSLSLLYHHNEATLIVLCAAYTIFVIRDSSFFVNMFFFLVFCLDMNHF